MPRFVAGAAAAGLLLPLLAATASANSFSRYGLYGPMYNPLHYGGQVAGGFFGGQVALSFCEKYAAVSDMGNPIVATTGGNQEVGTVFVFEHGQGKAAATGNWTLLASVTPDPALLPPYDPSTRLHAFGTAFALAADPSSPAGKARRQSNGLLLATVSEWDRVGSGTCVHAQCGDGCRVDAGSC